MPSTNILLYAKWESNEYQIRYVNELAEDKIQQVKFDSTINLIDVHSVNHIFLGWYLNENLFDTETYTYDYDIELVAKWHSLSGDLAFIIVDDYLKLISYEGNGTEVIIPNEILSYPVKIIGFEAFKGNKTIEKIVVGELVEYVEDFAFSSMSSLNTIEFSINTKFFGEKVLLNSNNIESIKVSSKWMKPPSWQMCRSIQASTC